MPKNKKPEPTGPEIAARQAAFRAFELAMRQAVMEYDAIDANGDHELDFREFSRLIRDREMGVHSETALLERFTELDADASGKIDLTEFIGGALRDAFSRSAANLEDIFAAWDTDGSGSVDMDEFRDAVRSFGFVTNDAIIDGVFTTLDYSNTGLLDLRDLRIRLEMEAAKRTRPMQQLRDKGDRDGDKGDSALTRMDGVTFAKIDHDWSAEEQRS